MDPAADIIKELTTNLLYLGTGVFALVGGLLAAMVGNPASNLHGRRVLVGALGVFGFSLLLGLFVFGMMIAAMIDNSFDPTDAVFRIVSGCQILAVAAASGLFFIFLCKNIWS